MIVKIIARYDFHGHRISYDTARKNVVGGKYAAKQFNERTIYIYILVVENHGIHERDIA